MYPSEILIFFYKQDFNSTLAKQPNPRLNLKTEGRFAIIQIFISLQSKLKTNPLGREKLYKQ
jgi:hypothetical protein